MRNGSTFKREKAQIMLHIARKQMISINGQTRQAVRLNGVDYWWRFLSATAKAFQVVDDA